MLLLLNVLESVNHEVIICSSWGLCWNPSPESGVLNPTHLSLLLKKILFISSTQAGTSRLFSCIFLSGSSTVFLYFFFLRLQRFNILTKGYLDNAENILKRKMSYSKSFLSHSVFSFNI